MTPPAVRAARPSFDQFYEQHFLPEHRHPVNRALHIAGTAAGLAWLPATLFGPLPWLVLLFPLVHAAPGLLGHRLFERNPQIGDLRVLRKDFPGHWFIAANHRLSAEVLRAALRRWRTPRA